MDQERSDLTDAMDPNTAAEDRGDTRLEENSLEFATSDSWELDLPNNEDAPAEAAQLKGQIDETRREMGETIDAIQERLSLENLSEQVSDHVTNAVETAKDAVYDATIGKAANYMKTFTNDISNTSIVRTAKENPLPFILIGLGAGLLIYQNTGGRSMSRHTGNRGQSARTGNGRDRDDRATFRSAGRSFSGVAHTVSDAAGTAYNKLTDAVDTAYSGAGEAVSQAYHKVEDLGSTARDQYDHYIQENPLAVGAVAFALGAAVGYALPTTRYEREYIGPARQNLVDKAQDTASDLFDKTKQAVTEAGRTITEQARSATEH